MSGALRLVGVLAILAGLAVALVLAGPLWLRGAYVLSGLVGSLLWFGLAEALDRLEALRQLLARPAVGRPGSSIQPLAPVKD